MGLLSLDQFHHSCPQASPAERARRLGTKMQPHKEEYFFNLHFWQAFFHHLLLPFVSRATFSCVGFFPIYWPFTQVSLSNHLSQGLYQLTKSK